MFLEVVVAPPSIYLEYVQSSVKSGIVVSAQNSWTEPKGAFTGEIRYVPIHSLFPAITFFVFIILLQVRK